MATAASVASIESLPDDEAVWIAALARREEPAIARLHALLLRAARFEVVRRGPGLQPAWREDLATQAADDALVAVLAKLPTFRGASRFTTWAYKFALLEAGVRTRRRAWQDREVSVDAERWAGFSVPDQPAISAERRELLLAINACIAELTPHQRTVLVALAIDGVPIDVLAERMATTRGALYKTLHDARRRLRARLAERGLNPEVP
ncbi:MAG TPA: sigma-70 family RNA polymerase sigma factor [Solirubrobacteraceae bacterium]